MRVFTLVLLLASISGSPVHAASCSAAGVRTLLDGVFSKLGRDCKGYASLFATDARYFHQHDGYKTGSELFDNCQKYAQFCPGDECKFLQNGQAQVISRGESCHVLVPYLWSEIPANHRADKNLEPHTGWEYMIVRPNTKSDYNVLYFAELESSYSVAFNWAKPDDTPAVVSESTLRLLALGNSASRGECNAPIAPTLTKFFEDKSRGGDVWRQQGDAVVLAAGGVCHVTVPYSAQVGTHLKTGRFVLVLHPEASDKYQLGDTVEFSEGLH